MPPPESHASLRYWALQLPGWGLTAIVLVVVWRAFDVNPAVLAALFGVLVLKDVVLYPLGRRALASPPQAGSRALLGARAVVVEALVPEGRVRIGAELWRALAPRDATPVAEGAAVRIEEVRGLVLIVRPETAD